MATVEERREYMRQYNAARREKQSAYYREWRARNAEHKRESDREYQRTHRERLNELSRAWVAANREKRREIARDWARRNRAQRREWYAEYQRRPEVMAARRANEARRRAAKHNARVGAFTASDVAQRMSMYGGLCWICRAAPWEHVDHVKPLAKGGPHILANLRPACAACNIRKRDTWPFARPAFNSRSAAA